MKILFPLLSVSFGLAAASSENYEYEENYEQEVEVHETGVYAGEGHPLYPPPRPPYWNYNPYYPPPNPYYHPPYNPHYPPYMPPHFQPPPPPPMEGEPPYYFPPQYQPPPPPPKEDSEEEEPVFVEPPYIPTPPMEEPWEEPPHIPPYYQPPPPMCCRPFVTCNEYQQCFVRGCMEWGNPFCSMNTGPNMTYPVGDPVFHPPPPPPGYVPHPVYDPPHWPPYNSTHYPEMDYPVVETHPPPSYTSVDDEMEDSETDEYPPMDETVSDPDPPMDDPVTEPDAPPSMDDPEAPPQLDPEEDDEPVDDPPPEPVTVPTPPEEVDVESGDDVLLVGANIWRIPPPSTLIPSMMASVGDTVIFQWNGNHDVWIHPSGTCSTDDAILVGRESGVWYTFTETGSHVFACDVGQHCELGMVMTIDVS